MFIGQVMGTTVGSYVFNKYGWRAAASLSLGWTGFMLLAILARGPHVPRHTWFGYAGGCEVRKSKLAERARAKDAEAGAADIDVSASTSKAASVAEKPGDEAAVEVNAVDLEKEAAAQT